MDIEQWLTLSDILTKESKFPEMRYVKIVI